MWSISAGGACASMLTLTPLDARSRMKRYRAASSESGFIAHPLPGQEAATLVHLHRAVGQLPNAIHFHRLAAVDADASADRAGEVVRRHAEAGHQSGWHANRSRLVQSLDLLAQNVGAMIAQSMIADQRPTIARTLDPVCLGEPQLQRNRV